MIYLIVRYIRDGRADKLVDCQARMSNLDRMKSELESQKSELANTVDEIRQDLAAQKVCSKSDTTSCSFAQCVSVLLNYIIPIIC